MIYLDTSVVVAYYCPEPISQQAEKVIRGKDPACISDLTEVEFASAVARKVRKGELAGDDAVAIRNQFVSHLELGIYRRTSLGPHHVRSARELISGFTIPLPTLDALHLAMASSAELRIVTADEGLARAAKAMSIKTTYLAPA